MIRLITISLFLGITFHAFSQDKLEIKENLFEEASEAFNEQKWEKVILLVDSWMESHPKDLDGYWLRGQAYEQIQNHEEALVDFSILLSLAPENAEAYFARGRVRYLLKQYQSGIEDFESFLALPPGETTRIIYRKGAGDQGFSQIMTAQSENPAEAYYHLGLCSFELGEFDQALSYFGTAIEYDQSNPDYYTEKGRSFARMGDNMLAISYYESALALNPNHLPAKQGLAAVKSGGDTALLSQLDEVIKDSLGNSQTYKQRGFYRMNHGDSIGAFEDFSIAIQLDSIDSESYYYRGKLSVAKKNWAEAEDDYSSAISLEDFNASYYLARGQGRYLSGKLEEALADFTLTVANDPTNPTGYYHRGITFQRMKRIQEACPELLKAIELGMEEAKAVWEIVCKD